MLTYQDTAELDQSHFLKFFLCQWKKF